MTAALVLAWKFDNGASQIHEFCAEVAACMEIVDGGAALWRGVAGDLQAQVLQLKAELREANDSLSFWLEKTYRRGGNGMNWYAIRYRHFKCLWMGDSWLHSERCRAWKVSQR